MRPPSREEGPLARVGGDRRPMLWRCYYVGVSTRSAASMKRTTVMLPADLRRRAFLRARERGVSLGELIRQSLDSSLPAAGPARAEDSLFADSEVFSGKA